ncbi:TonB-dependent receptor [Pedobacter cryoconitis]|uniref:Iron complex outermembrane receptor protein n=1 Tax=Pedobacter cryoconitis TaxID=188932 RepID=A0A7X0J0K1_9SPHI|nr:TonB-dependent receptor [Pedobacter cryoconitis]MBB6498823.1 iron complex outermembrane receptor protein [Pedobacter cryoconitis]
MNKILLLTAGMLLKCLICFAQQPATIKGSVTISNGKSAPHISITIKGIGVTSDEKGQFIIKQIKAGSYIIKASAVGIKHTEKNITLSAGETKIVNFILAENDEALQEVNIAAIKNKYKISLPSASLRLNEPLLEAPQNIQIVSEQVIKDQQITSMSDGLIRNVSGAIRTQHWADMYANIKMRGSQIQAFRNGFNVVNSFWGPLTEDMSFVDHVEFVKGPAGFMLGSGDPSGLYNVVTKKPTGIDKGEVSFTAGSYDMYRTTVDFDRKLTEDGKLLFRLNASGQNKKSHRDFEYNDRYSFAPVLSYQTGNTKITAEYVVQQAKMSQVGSSYIFGVKGYGTFPVDFSQSDPLIPPTTINDQSVTVNVQHRFDEHWKLTAQGAYYNYKMSGNSAWPSKVNADGTLIRSIGIWDAASSMKLAQVFLNGNFNTGGIQHRILAGFDAGNKKYEADWNASVQLDTDQNPFNSEHPVYGTNPAAYTAFNTRRLTPLKERAIDAQGLIGSKYHSFYLQEELGFFSNKLRLTLAGRYTDLSEYNWGTPPETPNKASQFSPRFGLSYSIDHKTSVYAVYDKAFIPQSGILRDNAQVKPLTGVNTEIGIKKDWFDNRFNTTLSLYRIVKQNELTSDPTDPRRVYSVVLGEKRVQGIEFDLRGEITRGLQLIANYAYTDGKVTKANPDVESIKVGDVVPGFAKHTANSWLSYTLQDGLLKGAGVSTGFSWQIGRVPGTWSRTDNKPLPNYFRLDGGLFWGLDKIKITGNVFNILNKYLYDGEVYNFGTVTTYAWQTEPLRNYRLSIAYRF